MSNYQVDKNGFYGEFGGAYVPEILYKCVKDLQDAYLPIIESEAFKQEYHALLKDTVEGLCGTSVAPLLCQTHE